MFTKKVLLMVALLAAVGMIASACAPQSAPPPVVQTRIVEQTKIVEKIVVATPAPSTAAANDRAFSVFQGTLLEKEKTPEVSTDELRQILAQKSATVFDVRPAKEFAISHIPGAVNATSADVQRLLPDKTSPIVLYCNGPFCPASKKASEELLQAGYTNIRRYQLGIPTWRALVGLTQIELEGVRYVMEGDKTAVLLDARSADQFKIGSLPSARNLVVAEVDAAKTDGRLPAQDHNTRIIVFGKDGAQARAVAESIAKIAFDNVAFYDGAWETLK
ncbi:MAG: sulfur transferase [Chloroflexota bacterium]|nr:sulfur transferase [Chloroflexota bacterium]